VCGNDGCGGSCGGCQSGYACNTSGQCVSTGGCTGVPAWDPNKPWYNYVLNEVNQRNNKKYQCTNVAYCIYDPVGSFGSYGWQFVSDC
jgi:hypothetical protein